MKYFKYIIFMSIFSFSCFSNRGREKCEGDGSARRIGEIVFAAPHLAVGKAAFRSESHDLRLREDPSCRAFEIRHRMNGKLRGEKRHEKIGNVRHGSGDALGLLQAESKILFLIEQGGKLLQGRSFLSFQ